MRDQISAQQHFCISRFTDCQSEMEEDIKNENRRTAVFS